MCCSTYLSERMSTTCRFRSLLSHRAFSKEQMSVWGLLLFFLFFWQVPSLPTFVPPSAEISFLCNVYLLGHCHQLQISAEFWLRNEWHSAKSALRSWVHPHILVCFLYNDHKESHLILQYMLNRKSLGE